MLPACPTDCKVQAIYIIQIAPRGHGHICCWAKLAPQEWCCRLCDAHIRRWPNVCVNLYALSPGHLSYWCSSAGRACTYYRCSSRLSRTQPWAAAGQLTAHRLLTEAGHLVLCGPGSLGASCLLNRYYWGQTQSTSSSVISLSSDSVLVGTIVYNKSSLEATSQAKPSGGSFERHCCSSPGYERLSRECLVPVLQLSAPQQATDHWRQLPKLPASAHFPDQSPRCRHTWSK